MKIFDKLKVFIGFKYRVNFNSMEIHNLKKTHVNCHLKKMNNFKDVTESKMLEYLSNGYNGCRWCFSSKNTDRR